MQTRPARALWIYAAALVAAAIKLLIAWNTIGTNDVVVFYKSAQALAAHGLEWTYANQSFFTHPPLTAYYLRAICGFANQPFFTSHGLTFPFLLRLPGVIADFVVLAALLIATERHRDLRLPTWSFVLLTLSPVSIMVSGFHGNTDPVMVMFLVLAALMLLTEKAELCAVLLALSCQIKVIPLLLFPVFFFFWFSRTRTLRFIIPFALTMLLCWAEPLVRFPSLFAKNVLAYASYWGIWGITYLLRITGLPEFSRVSFVGLSTPQELVMAVLKFTIITCVLFLAWRRRKGSGRDAIDTVAYAWILFFILSPGIAVQYMVWLAPFVLILSPKFYAWLTAASAAFLFCFYNVTAHGFPWRYAVSTNALNNLWAPWSLLPWMTLIAGLVWMWRRVLPADAALTPRATESQ